MSLINDALKRASEAQKQQASPGPRGPKGPEALPPPVSAVGPRSRQPFMPAVGLGAVVVVLFSLSIFFFYKYWQGNAEPDVPEGMDMLESRIISEADYNDFPPGQGPVRVAKATTPPTPSTSPKSNSVVTTPAPVTNAVVSVTPPRPPVQPKTTPSPKSVQVAITNPIEPPAPDVRRPAVKPPATGDATAEFPELRLQGIIFRRKNPSAFINGKTLYVGDLIGSAELIEIDIQFVMFELGGERKKLFLLR